MRLRHIQGAEESIAASPYVVREPEQYKGAWYKLFGNSRPIHIEVGMGKGQFIMELASRNPDINYIGIERYSSVLLRALQKRRSMELDNICFMCIDAKSLDDIFAPGEADRIYLNFSDPWPKDRHAKRRLTSPEFMALYNRVLSGRGTVEFKTDNRRLFEYSLESIPAAGWDLDAVTYDLHHSGLAAGNVMTEYEMKFSAKGNPIHKLVASRAQECCRASNPPSE